MSRGCLRKVFGRLALLHESARAPGQSAATPWRRDGLLWSPRRVFCRQEHLVRTQQAIRRQRSPVSDADRFCGQTTWPARSSSPCEMAGSMFPMAWKSLSHGVHGGRLGRSGPGRGWPGFHEAMSVIGCRQRPHQGVHTVGRTGCGDGAAAAMDGGGFHVFFWAWVRTGAWRKSARTRLSRTLAAG